MDRLRRDELAHGYAPVTYEEACEVRDQFLVTASKLATFRLNALSRGPDALGHEYADLVRLHTNYLSLMPVAHVLFARQARQIERSCSERIYVDADGHLNPIPKRSCDTCRYGDKGPVPEGCSAECWEPELIDWDPDLSSRRNGE
jgi:hypothetical protein